MLKPFHTQGLLEAGCDEAGRGCLAGPVSAAAVILPEDFYHKKLNDSKQLSEKDRYTLREVILKDAIAYGVTMVDHKEIDQINILKASILGMHRSLDQLDPRPEHILVDGNRFLPYNFIPYQCVVKGDAKFLSIAAASVLAKTYRDDLMKEMHAKYPQYHWDRNKGYPTVDHRKAIQEHGPSPIHRMSFKLLKS
ncbi:ribonuclease HII [bacterium SCSIO 12741]|nr:ribonuclease HII [bacterium SCSIO 12741]